MQKLRVLCVHGVGNHPVNGEWQASWIKALEESFDRLSSDNELEISFFNYDAHFANTSLSALGTLEAVAKMTASGIVHGFDDFFTSREISPSQRPETRAARGIRDRLRWTAGMVVKWAENEELRNELRKSLASTITAEEPHVVFAHSLGSLVAYDTFQNSGLPALCQNRTFVSFGSQIGNPFVRSIFAGRIQPIDCGYWYHLFNVHDDVFTTTLDLHDEKFEQVLTSFDIDGVADHDATHYLSHINVTHSVWSDLVSTKGNRSLARSTRSQVRSSGTHQRKALIIGIDEYRSEDMRLEGCVNDAFLMSEVLQENGFQSSEIRLLLDQRATTEEIWRRLDWLLEGTRAGEERVLCFSGHGAQIPDYGAEETIDRVDECLVPVDFDWSKDRAITDDRFYELYSQLPYDAKFIAVLDCCHSGGMTRSGGAKPRGLSPPDDIRHRVMQWDKKKQIWTYRKPPVQNESLDDNRKTREIGYLGANGQRRLFRATDILRLNNRSFNSRRKQLGHLGPYLPVILQACQEHQLAYEYRHGVTSYGAFTYSLAKALRSSSSSSTDLGRLEQLVQRSVIDIADNQNPVFVAPAPRFNESLF
ncbi:MAG: caspase family protein [Roseibium sp.]|uniref:caspase family protein n=1 Tax=Roseibium sp. TaxID=1936156 RepID=UPI0026245A50|nr:caspase family protein [Roseibium sp.]MCV0425928.1 caspase family protein [Roseibium sp.]